TLFPCLSAGGLNCEVICVCNGCTDRTPAVAVETFDQLSRKHFCADGFRSRTATVRERGKLNAWNQFVHNLSAKEAQYLLMMDADILLNRPETLWNMLLALEGDPEANVAVDRPCKDLLFKRRKSIADCVSLIAAQITLSADAQLCAQLYCIRAGVARNIYL